MDADKFHTEGTLIAIDLWGVTFETLNHPILLCQMAKQAVEKAEMQVLGINIIPFHPQGLSLALILGESHLTIHTSPEDEYVAIDVFTCGKGKPLAAAEYFCEVLKPKRVAIKELKRGIRCPW